MEERAERPRLVRSARRGEEDLVQPGEWAKALFRSLSMATTKNGWPSVTYPGVEPNSPTAVASIAEESVGAHSDAPSRSLTWLARNTSLSSTPSVHTSRQSPEAVSVGSPIFTQTTKSQAMGSWTTT